MNQEYFFILFHSIHDVLRAEKKLKSKEIEYELVPVPRQLSSDCGVCIKLKDIDSILDNTEIQGVEACYFYDSNNFKEFKR